MVDMARRAASDTTSDRVDRFAGTRETGKRLRDTIGFPPLLHR
jgi:hypothetical protein